MNNIEIIFIASILVPVGIALVVWGAKIYNKLGVICVNHANLVDSLKSHNLESKISEAKLSAMEVKVALLEKDIKYLKEKIGFE